MTDMNKIKLMLAVLAVAILAVACRQDDARLCRDLCGMWSMSNTYHAEGIATEVEQKMNFASDGKVNMAFSAEVEGQPVGVFSIDGTWRISDGKLTVEYDQSSVRFVADADLAAAFPDVADGMVAQLRSRMAQTGWRSESSIESLSDSTLTVSDASASTAVSYDRIPR